MTDDPTRPLPDVQEPDDDALARLRAADPAREVEPDEARLVAALVAATTGPGDGAAAGGTSAPADEIAAARERRRPARWLQVAAAVAGVAVVGGGGYLLGSAGAGGAASYGTVAEVQRDAGGSIAPQPGREGSAVTGATADGAVAGPAAVGDAGRLAWFGGRTVFTASGLSDSAGSARAWALDAAGAFSAQTAARLAAALGVAGEPVDEGGAWVVGPQDGSAASVSLMPDGPVSFSFYDPTRDPWACARSAPDSVTSDKGGGAVSVKPMPAPSGPGACDDRVAPAPTQDAAKQQVTDLMTALGLDPADFGTQIQDAGTPSAVTVLAYRLVGGERTGITWSVLVTADGVQSAWGALAALVDLGQYDVVSPAAAVARLGDPRFGPSSGGVMPLAEAAASGPTDAARAGLAPAPPVTPTVPVTPQPGSAFAWPVQQVTITGARLGLALTTLPDGAAVLLPTYELSAADGSTWSVLAVADAMLTF